MHEAALPILTWPGKPTAPSAPAACLRPAIEPSSPLSIIGGDNLAAMQALSASLAGQVDLIYLDPPFFTGREHAAVERRRDPKTGTIDRKLSPAFDDRWQSMTEYLGELMRRLQLAHSLLAPHGCLILHVDPKTSHYAKLVCDELFGPQCFASEIIWRYRRWPAKTKNFQRVHDVLLRYVRDASVPPRFCQLYEPLAASTRATWGDKKQRAVVNEQGRRCRSSKTAEATPGAPLGDVWEIGIIAPVSRERTGYPTQKPEALLERIVLACTEPGDLVLDPYLGSGTTLAVCARLGRRAIGIDASPKAIALAAERLGKLGTTPTEHSLLLGRPGARSAASKAGGAGLRRAARRRVA